MTYYYFVSYHVSTENGSFGFGNVEMSLNEQITTMDQINGIKEWICRDLISKGMKKTSISIISYSFLRTE